jgi:hypothetical protein
MYLPTDVLVVQKNPAQPYIYLSCWTIDGGYDFARIERLRELLNGVHYPETMFDMVREKSVFLVYLFWHSLTSAVAVSFAWNHWKVNVELYIVKQTKAVAAVDGDRFSWAAFGEHEVRKDAKNLLRCCTESFGESQRV